MSILSVRIALLVLSIGANGVRIKHSFTYPNTCYFVPLMGGINVPTNITNAFGNGTWEISCTDCSTLGPINGPSYYQSAVDGVQQQQNVTFTSIYKDGNDIVVTGQSNAVQNLNDPIWALTNITLRIINQPSCNISNLSNANTTISAITLNGTLSVVTCPNGSTTNTPA